MDILMDLAVILILILSCIIMAKKGFVKAVYSLGANVITLILLAMLITPVTDAMLKTSLGDMVYESVLEITDDKIPEFSQDIVDNSVESIVKIITSVLLFIVIKIIVAMLFKLLSSIFNLPVLSQLNFLAGGLAGIINGLLIIYIACAVISLDLEWTMELRWAAKYTSVFKFFYENNLLINMFI